MANERKELVRYMVISGIAACVIALGLSVASGAYRRHIEDLSWGNAIAEKVARHGLSYFCKGGLR